MSNNMPLMPEFELVEKNIKTSDGIDVSIMMEQDKYSEGKVIIKFKHKDNDLDFVKYLFNDGNSDLAHTQIYYIEELEIYIQQHTVDELVRMLKMIVRVSEQ